MHDVLCPACGHNDMREFGPAYDGAVCAKCEVVSTAYEIARGQKYTEAELKLLRGIRA